MIICHINFARGFRGGERQTLLLIEALAAHGIQQHFIGRKDSPLHEKLASIPNLTCHPVLKPYMKNLPLLRKIKPDLLHAHDAKAAQWSLLSHYYYRLPYVMTRRISKPSKKVAFTLAVYRNAARVIGLSRAVRDSIHTILPGLSVDIIPSMYASLPVNQGALQELKQKYTEYFVVGHIGALVNPHKGQAVLIDAVKILNQRHKHLKFLLLGSGKDEALLKQLSTAAEGIEFIGFVEDVGTWINVFDLFVFPSLEEGLGSTLLDVMQHKKPIIASAVGGILDVVQDRENGLLVEAGNPTALAAAIDELVQDPALRERFGQAGFDSLERFSPENVAQRYHDIYTAVLNS